MSSQSGVILGNEDEKHKSNLKFSQWRGPSSSQFLLCKLRVRRAEFILYNNELPTMDWINCNTCCRQPGDERERKFVLSSCGHIFCDVCLMQADSQGKCIVCKKECQFMQLSSKMKPDAEVFFLEPGELLKRQFTQINRLLDFQKEHRTRLVSFHRRILQKYKDLQKQYAAVTSRVQELDKKYSASSNRIQELEVENSKLRNIINNQVSLGGGGGLPSSSYSSPVPDAYAGLTHKSPSQIQGPSSKDGTRISPGRLTLVKTGQGTRCVQSPVNMKASQSGVNSTLGQTRMSGNLIHTTQGTYFTPPQVQSHSGYASQQCSPAPPGAGCYRSSSVAPSSTPSPTGAVANSVGRMTLMPYGQQLPEAKQCQYPSYVSPPYHGSHSNLRSTPLPRPVKHPGSSVGSPSSKMQIIGHHNMYNKFL
ncbi:probable E3 SUMO-protein ligase RNF212 isoform X2 [Macrobrachium rosenbergii]|uniref:probable E3 SUMO-protein ligase RNF212 isoform X2 n=1 Tax=Macrobrachium rosenbergii TaxID=79674 RepID=UPI0034D6C20F